jgi:hypothetical protein
MLSLLNERMFELMATPQLSNSDGEIIVQGVKLKNAILIFRLQLILGGILIDYFLWERQTAFAKYLSDPNFLSLILFHLLKANNMPEDLVYLAMMKADLTIWPGLAQKAVAWQFILLLENVMACWSIRWIDETQRYQEVDACCCGVFIEIFIQFFKVGNWQHCHNAGEAKIARGVRMLEAGFLVLAKHRFLRPETRD